MREILKNIMIVFLGMFMMVSCGQHLGVKGMEGQNDTNTDLNNKHQNYNDDASSLSGGFEGDSEGDSENMLSSSSSNSNNNNNNNNNISETRCDNNSDSSDSDLYSLLSDDYHYQGPSEWDKIKYYGKYVLACGVSIALLILLFLALAGF